MHAVRSPEYQSINQSSNDPSPHPPTTHDPKQGETDPSFKSGGGGLMATAPDYMKFAQMLLNGGELGDVRVLSEVRVGVGLCWCWCCCWCCGGGFFGLC